MSWNYRIVKTETQYDNEFSYDVCEVYYDKDDKPISYALGKNVLSMDESEDLKWAYKEIRKAFEKSVLKITNGKLIETEEVLGVQ